MSDCKCEFMMTDEDAEDMPGAEDEKIEELNEGLLSGKEYFQYAVMEEHDGGVWHFFHHEKNCSHLSIFGLTRDAAKKVKELQAEYPERKFFMVALGSIWRQVPIDYKPPHN